MSVCPDLPSSPPSRSIDQSCSAVKPFQILLPSIRNTTTFPTSDEVVSGDIITVINTADQQANIKNGCQTVFGGAQHKVVVSDSISGRLFGGTAVCSTNVTLTVISDQPQQQPHNARVCLVPYTTTGGFISNPASQCGDNWSYVNVTQYKVYDCDDDTTIWNGMILDSPYNLIRPSTADVTAFASMGIATFSTIGGIPVNLTWANEQWNYPVIDSVTNVTDDKLDNLDIFCQTGHRGGFPTSFPFITKPKEAVVVKLLVPASGGGKYLGYIAPMPEEQASSTYNILQTGDVDEVDFTQTASASSLSCLIINVNEFQQSTHKLSAGFYLGEYRHINSDGTKVVAISEGDTSSSSASLTPLTTLGSNTEGSESSDTASWTRGDHAVAVWNTSRVVYNDAGDKVLYAFVRKYTYDTFGDLYSISSETRYTIDTPEAC